MSTTSSLLCGAVGHRHRHRRRGGRQCAVDLDERRASESRVVRALCVRACGAALSVRCACVRREDFAFFVACLLHNGLLSTTVCGCHVCISPIQHEISYCITCSMVSFAKERTFA